MKAKQPSREFILNRKTYTADDYRTKYELEPTEDDAEMYYEYTHENGNTGLIEFNPNYCAEHPYLASQQGMCPVFDTLEQAEAWLFENGTEY